MSTEPQSTKSPQQWWINVMQYIREVSGTVYVNDLKERILNEIKSEINPDTDTNSKTNLPNNPPPTDLSTLNKIVTEINNGNIQIVDFLNCCGELNSTINSGYLKTQPITGEVYTVPYYRKKLDALIHTANTEYYYNKFLYDENFSIDNSNDEFCNLLSNSNEGFIEIIDNTDVLHCHINFDKITTNRTTDKLLHIHNFDISKLVNHITKTITYIAKPLHIKSFNASKTIFSGDTNLNFSSPHMDTLSFDCGIDFSDCTFEKDICIQNMTFDFANSPRNESINFRNCRFFGSVDIKDLTLENTNTDNCLSFEDSRIDGNLAITNCSLEHAKLYLFQTVLGDYTYNLINPARTPSDIKSFTKNKKEIRFTNIDFEGDASIDMIDIEMLNGTVLFQNISSVPKTDLWFVPWIIGNIEYCPFITVALKNCQIDSKFTIGNVAQLAFKDCQNYGKIICEKNWKDVNKTYWDMLYPYKYRQKTQGIIGTLIKNPMNLAAYNSHFLFGMHDLRNDNTDINENTNENTNKGHSKLHKRIINENNYYKALSFVILKENFVSLGMYDDEDAAFILYMEFKPYIDGYRKSRFSLASQKGHARSFNKKHGMSFLYNILYATGAYGISPVRVIVSLFVTILLFTGIYTKMELDRPGTFFKLGSTTIMGISDSDIEQNNLETPIYATEKTSTKHALVRAFSYSLEEVIPFASGFEPGTELAVFLSAIENFLGTFLIGYFSVAIIRKTLR